MFHTVFRMAKSGSPGSSARLKSLPLSIAFHGLAVAAVALLSARSMREPGDPILPIVFLEGNAPPPLAGDAAADAEEGMTEIADSEATLQPREEFASQPDLPPLPQMPLAERPENSAARIAGDPEGRSDGLREGKRGSTGLEGPDVGGSQKLFRPGGNVVEPRLLYRVEPLYAEAARKARAEGVVILEAIIGAAGDIEQLKVVKSVNALLDASALDAVRRWHYRPATLNGRPVRVYLTVTVDFRLR